MIVTSPAGLLGQPLGLGERVLVHVARRDGATFGRELHHELPAHATAAPGDHGQLSCERVHVRPPRDAATLPAAVVGPTGGSVDDDRRHLQWAEVLGDP